MKPIIKKIVAFAAIIPISVGIGLTAINGDVSQEAQAATTYEKLTASGFSIDSNAQYVLGIDGTGFHYAGSSSWGLTALPSAQTPLYYTLTLVDAGAKTFTARTVIGSTTYYLTIPTTNTFTMSSSSTTIRIATSQSDPDAVSHISIANRHIRRNGTSGLRSYATSTGSAAYFTKSLLTRFYLAFLFLALQPRRLIMTAKALTQPVSPLQPTMLIVVPPMSHLAVHILLLL